METRTCIADGCGKTFSASMNRRTCSPECAKKNRRKLKRASAAKRKISRPKTRVCAVSTCSNLFVVSGHKKTCSERCAKIRIRESKKFRETPSERCSRCGKCHPIGTLQGGLCEPCIARLKGPDPALVQWGGGSMVVQPVTNRETEY